MQVRWKNLSYRGRAPCPYNDGSGGPTKRQGVLSMFVIGLYMALLLDLATLWPKLSTLVICFVPYLEESSTWDLFFRGLDGTLIYKPWKNHLVGVYTPI